MPGHKLHYSHIENLGDIEYVGRIADPQGRDCGGDGITCHNVDALYTHLHFAGQPQVPLALMQTARDQRKIRVQRHD